MSLQPQDTPQPCTSLQLSWAIVKEMLHQVVAAQPFVFLTFYYGSGFKTQRAVLWSHIVPISLFFFLLLHQGAAKLNV